MLLIATVGIVYSDLFVRVPHHVPCVLALFPRSAPDPQVVDPRPKPKFIPAKDFLEPPHQHVHLI